MNTRQKQNSVTAQRDSESLEPGKSGAQQGCGFLTPSVGNRPSDGSVLMATAMGKSCEAVSTPGSQGRPGGSKRRVNKTFPTTTTIYDTTELDNSAETSATGLLSRKRQRRSAENLPPSRDPKIRRIHRIPASQGKDPFKRRPSETEVEYTRRRVKEGRTKEHPP
ncbi:hypothetical protein PGB90_007357 [Kerria lacca]